MASGVASGEDVCGKWWCGVVWTVEVCGVVWCEGAWCVVLCAPPGCSRARCRRARSAVPYTTGIAAAGASSMLSVAADQSREGGVVVWWGSGTGETDAERWLVFSWLRWGKRGGDL